MKAKNKKSDGLFEKITNPTMQFKEENMATKMASEENFIRSELSNKDLEALCIIEDPQKALEKLLCLAKNENITEK